MTEPLHHEVHEITDTLPEPVGEPLAVLGDAALVPPAVAVQLAAAAQDESDERDAEWRRELTERLTRSEMTQAEMLAHLRELRSQSFRSASPPEPAADALPAPEAVELAVQPPPEPELNRKLEKANQKRSGHPLLFRRR